MIRKLVLVLALLGSFLLAVPTARADDSDVDADYPWRFHAAPFAFTFGNQIDSHQQSRVVDGGMLQGFLYIHDTGTFTTAGLPIAERARCPHMECHVGWVLKGVFISAVLVQKAPRIWLVDSGSLPQEPGYNHFQWLGEPHTPHDLVIGQTYNGILLKRIAPEPFFWLGGSGSSRGGGHDEGGSGGCSGDPGDCSGDTGECGDDTGGCSSDSGGCTDGCSGDSGGCGGHESGGYTGGGGDSGGHGGGSGGRIVPEGVDSHTNLVTVWDGTWTGGCDGHDGGSGSCDGHDGSTGGCDGHDGSTGGCEDGSTGGCDDGSTGGCDGHTDTSGTSCGT